MDHNSSFNKVSPTRYLKLPNQQFRMGMYILIHGLYASGTLR